MTAVYLHALDPLTISGQLDMAAWEHEPRNAHGEWTSEGGPVDLDAPRFREAFYGDPADAAPPTAEVILAEWYESTDDPAGPHLNRAAAALHAGDRMGAAGELELAAACHGDGETGDRLCRMAISLARTGAAP